MSQLKSNCSNQYFQLSKILSSSTFDTLAFDDINSIELNSKFLIDFGIIVKTGTTFQDGLDKCYKKFTKNYRNEYVYKNIIFNELVLKRHSLEKCSIIPEFRVGKSKADLAVFNGTSTVYEIKTELDNLDRLPNQLIEYSKVFDKIYVVTNTKYLKDVVDIIPDHVGVYILEENLKLIEFRSALSNKKNVINSIIMESLRKDEYSYIVHRAYQYVPDVPNMRYYKACEELIEKLDNSVTHDLMVQALLNRALPEQQIRAIKKLPYSLKSMSVSKRYTVKQWTKIEANIKLLVN